MGASTPSMEDVLIAVHDVIEAISPVAPSVILPWENSEDDETITLEKYQETSGELFIAFMNCTTVPVYGRAVGMDFGIFQISIRLLTLLIGVPNWSFESLKRAQTIVRWIDQSNSIFMISDQPQLVTDTGAWIQSHELVVIGGQRIWQAVIRL